MVVSLLQDQDRIGGLTAWTLGEAEAIGVSAGLVASLEWRNREGRNVSTSYLRGSEPPCDLGLILGLRMARRSGVAIFEARFSSTLQVQKM